MAIPGTMAVPTLDKSIVTTGTSLGITITPPTPPAHDCWTTRYTVNGTTVTLETKGTSVSFTIPYSTLASYLGGDNSAEVVVEVDTYLSGSFILGTRSASALVKTPAMALSLWDDMQGNVGATFGLEASGPGVNVMIDSAFGSSAVHPHIDFSNSKVDQSEWFNYQAGDTYSVDAEALFPGLISNSAQTIAFDICLPKSAAGRTLTVTALTLTVRGVNGIVASSDYDFLNNSTVTATVDSADGRHVVIRCVKTGAWSNAVNNTPVTVKPGLSAISISFS